MMNDFFLLFPITTALFLGLFFLAIGSLLNVIIHRLPLMLENEWAVQCRALLKLPETHTKKINLFLPRSFCPHCKTTIPFWHNIPLISYCLLKGRCRKCHQPIAFRYPFVEALCLILSLFAVYFFGIHTGLIYILLFIWILIVLFMIDLEHQLLPDSLTLGLLWLGLIANSQQRFTSLPNAVLSAVGAYLFLWLLIKLFYWCTNKIGMGHGDFKLFAAFGAWFGWTQLPFILLVSSITGAITGLIYLKTTRQTRDTPIAFGPFLCIAGLISLFYGKIIVQWYVKLYI